MHRVRMVLTQISSIEPRGAIILSLAKSSPALALGIMPMTEEYRRLGPVQLAVEKARWRKLSLSQGKAGRAIVRHLRVAQHASGKMTRLIHRNFTRLAAPRHSRLWTSALTRSLRAFPGTTRVRSGRGPRCRRQVRA